MPIIKIRRGTTEQWSTSNKVLQVGELGIDVTLNKVKAGNGNSLWTALPWLHTTPEEVTIQYAGMLSDANDYTDAAITSLGNTVDGAYVPISDVGNPDGVASLDINGKIPDSEISNSIARINYLDQKQSVRIHTYTLQPGNYVVGTNNRDTINGQLNQYLVLDGMTMNVGDRILFTNETGQSTPSPSNGIWVVVNTGEPDGKNPGSPYQLIRAEDCIPTESYNAGSFTFVESGTAKGQGWVSPGGSGTWEWFKFSSTPLTGYATETYVNTAVANLVDTAPDALNTLNELAAAINDDASFASTVTTALGNKLDSNYVTIGNTLLEGISGQTYGLIGTSAYLDVKNTNGYNKEIELDIAAVKSQLDTDGYVKQAALNAKLDTSSFTYESITIPVYNTVGDLPIASSNHGRWAHVHGEGAMYYAHGGSWYKALSQDDLYISTNAQSSSYTLGTSDLGKLIEMSNGGTLTITDSSSFPVGFSADILQTGSSQVTIAGNGFTPNATPGLKLRSQWSSATVVKRGLNSWVVFGDLSA